MNKKIKFLVFISVLSTLFFFDFSALAAASCTKSGDPCALTDGQAGKCGVSHDGKMRCYSETSPEVVAASGATGTGGISGNVINFPNPLQYKTVDEFLTAILFAVQRIIVALALVFIVIGAVFILTSAGNPDMVERGKKAITMAIIGLAIGMAAPSILKELAIILGWGPTSNATVNSAYTLSQIAVEVLNFLLGIAGILALVMLVIGGIAYLTSAGDEDRIEWGKKTFTYSVIGIIVVMSAMVIVRQIAAFFTAG